MEAILIIVVVAVLWAVLRPGRRSTPKANSADKSTGRQRVLDGNARWLKERWLLADEEMKAGQLKHFPKWYFDPATDRQRARLSEEGVSGPRGATKGQLSDIIGLFVDPDGDDLEKLKFFGVTLKGAMRNQTRARHEVAALNEDPEKARAWLMRPASPLQREFYRLMGEKPPPGLTHEQAEARIAEAGESMTDEQDDEWSTLEGLVEEFEDRELRSELEIRKPSPADVRAAMAALKAEGKECNDPLDIAEKLRAMKPALGRNGSSELAS